MPLGHFWMTVARPMMLSFCVQVLVISCRTRLTSVSKNDNWFGNFRMTRCRVYMYIVDICCHHQTCPHYFDCTRTNHKKLLGPCSSKYARHFCTRRRNWIPRKRFWSRGKKNVDIAWEMYGLHKSWRNARKTTWTPGHREHDTTISASQHHTSREILENQQAGKRWGHRRRGAGGRLELSNVTPDQLHNTLYRHTDTSTY